MSDRRKMKKVVTECIKRILPIVTELLEDTLKTKQKRIWTRKWILRRGSHGASVGLLRELESEGRIEYRAFVGMHTEQFGILLRDIADTIKRSATIMRYAIAAREKLQISLYFLATGSSFRSLQHLFRVSKAIISTFLPEALDAIYHNLNDYNKVREITKYYNFISCL
jgi:ribosomal protein S25